MAGRKFNDLELAGQVRTLALGKIKAILEQEEIEDKEFYKAILLRLAPTILPRLNEHTGADGTTLVMKFDSVYDKTSDTTRKTETDSTKSS